MTTFARDFKFISKEEINRRVSVNIKKYRKLANITQEQLAVDIGRHYDFVRRLEFSKGKKSCSKETLYRISVVLDTPIDKFFE
jgi:transcriptional regulator with XRE-family HTH domain